MDWKVSCEVKHLIKHQQNLLDAKKRQLIDKPVFIWMSKKKRTEAGIKF